MWLAKPNQSPIRIPRVPKEAFFKIALSMFAAWLFIHAWRMLSSSSPNFESESSTQHRLSRPDILRHLYVSRLRPLEDIRINVILRVAG